MTRILVVSISSVMMLAVSAADVLLLKVHSSMRIPNNRIEIRVEDSGKVAIKTQDIRSEWVSRETTIGPAELAELTEKLSSINWAKASKDTVQGLDGTSVSLDHADKKVRVWSPEYRSKERDLIGLQQAVEHIYQLAGLTENGMPPKKP